MEKDNYSKTCHAGHRGRLTDQILDSGVENINKIQCVEEFLTYIFPRGDVNPLAHRLLDKYGTFANILDATIEDLRQVKGINERSAKKIKVFRQLFTFYGSSKLQKGVSIKNNKEFFDYAEHLLRYESNELLYLFAIGGNFRLIQKRCYTMKSVREVGISPYDLLDFVRSTHLKYLIAIHNHPDGICRPSKDDVDAMSYIDSLIDGWDCKLVDCFIIGEDGIFSERNQSYVRHYNCEDNLINILNI